MNKLILLTPFLLLMLMGIAGATTPSAIPSGIQYYVPLNLTNSQSTATSAPFQQMVNITESTYSSYIAYNGNLANFEIFNGTGAVRSAWIESNSSGVLRVWVKLPNGIPANSKVTLYLGFAAKTTNLLSSSGTSGIGEAPQLSSTYAEYDDGASVFNNYWNFAGTTLPSTFDNQLAGSGGSYTVDNGITLTITTGGAGYYEHVYSTSTYNPVGQIVEALQTTHGGGADEVLQWAVSLGASGSDGWGNINVVGFGYDGNGDLEVRTVSGGAASGYQGASITTPGIVGGSWQATGTDEAFWNYTTTEIGGSTNQPTIGNAYIDLFIDNNAGSTTFQYIRTRAYPPSGVMPSVTFGAVQSATIPTLSISPNPATYGQSVTITATCHASTDTCAIDYPSLGTAIATGTGSATYTYNAFSLGAGVSRITGRSYGYRLTVCGWVGRNRENWINKLHSPEGYAGHYAVGRVGTSAKPLDV